VIEKANQDRARLASGNCEVALEMKATLNFCASYSADKEALPFYRHHPLFAGSAHEEQTAW